MAVLSEELYEHYKYILVSDVDDIQSGNRALRKSEMLFWYGYVMLVGSFVGSRLFSEQDS